MIGNIYCIYLKNNDQIYYIGNSLYTIEYILDFHKINYKKWLNGEFINIDYSLLNSYFSIYGIENFEFKIIKIYNILDQQHLNAYECLYKKKSINVKSTFIDKFLFKKIKQYKNYNRWYKRQKSNQQYRERNKKILLEKNKEYRKDNKERLSNYRKQYNIIKNNFKKKYDCILCDYITYTKSCLTRHFKTKKHKKNLEILKNPLLCFE